MKLSAAVRTVEAPESPLDSDELLSFLDRISLELRPAGAEPDQRQVQAALDRLSRSLRARRAADTDTWEEVVQTVRRHRLHGILRSDPFTNHAFSRPRGYPGDAALIDLIYGTGTTPVPEDPGVKSITLRNLAVPACRAVRYRRLVAAELILSTLEACHAPRVLSVACGHLREAELLPKGALAHCREVVAMDADQESLSVAEQYGRETISGLPLRIKDLLSHDPELGTFDLIYSLGLLDYLTDRMAAALVAALVRRLSPGGRLVVANFLPQPVDVGYMEACMDWYLIYRDERGMQALVEDVPSVDLGSVTATRDPDQQIVVQTVVRC
ncbi:MAG: class I SAM-dependent methyltransferase [Gemmatimonadota bacterium]